MNNVGEFRAVRDISLHPIKLQPKEDEAEEEELSPLPSKPQGASSINSLSASFNHINTHTAEANNCCTVTIENAPTKKLELTAVDPRAVRKKVSKSTETLTKAADEIELLAANQPDIEADPLELEMITDTVI